MTSQSLHRHPERQAAMGVLLLLMSAGVSSQQAPHVCGAGPGPNEVMAGVQPAGPGVAPTPLCYWKSDEQGQVTPQVRWSDRWGALAQDGEGVLGVAVNASSKAEAEKVALADCVVRGGGNCDISMTYYNQCAVVAAGEVGSYIARAETESEASDLALSGCKSKAGAGECRIYYSGCSLPVQVQ